MCGIAGIFGETDVRAEHVQRMSDALRHRGPDDEGIFCDADAGIALGHRRLSIIDLSPMGHQPMFSASGRYVISFNGEVYNFERIREELPAGTRLRGHSDTEVMLAAIEAWGLREAVGRFVGMFAFALWDRHEGRLHLVRDRLGVKPLYYGWWRRTLLFGSELKALAAYPGFGADIDPGAVALLLRHNYIPAPYTIYSGIYKLIPGSILSVSSPGQRPEPQRYWSVAEAAQAGADQPFTGEIEEAIEELDSRLRDAIKLRMISDVPLGAFLSGGLDSSTVVALMQAQSTQPVRTFSIGFREADFSEGEAAARIARHLGTEHTALEVRPEDALGIIPELAGMYDEPFADSSQIPTALVCRLARSQVTVAVSGDGGDELFAGYTRHRFVQQLSRVLRGVPWPVRATVARALTSVSPGGWNRLGDMAAQLIGRAHVNYGDKIHKTADCLRLANPDAIYLRIHSHWDDMSALVCTDAELPTVFTQTASWPKLRTAADTMMFLDQAVYMPDDNLAKVDRASMAVSLEVREPLIDHRVMEFAWRLPTEWKLRDGRNKWILRRVLQNYVPAALVEQPKMGFSVPIGPWLRGPLRDWAESLLEPGRLAQSGLFHVPAIRQVWDDHCKGKRSTQHLLWGVLMFQSWLEAAAVRPPAGTALPYSVAR